MMINVRLLMSIFLLARSLAVFSQEALTMPRDVDQVQIYLLTVDSGQRMDSMFGHAAVRIQDFSARTDSIYSFDSADPAASSYSINFIKGTIPLRVGMDSYNDPKRPYLQKDRTTWQDQLNFTKDQKARFLEKMVWQTKQENRIYNSHYFSDNSVTRLRDYMDYALEGKLAKATKTVQTPDTYRSKLHSQFKSMTLKGSYLDILLNGRLDQKLSKWDELFLPFLLRSNLAILKNDDENAVLINSELLVEGSRKDNDFIHASIWFGFLLLLPLFVGVVLKRRDLLCYQPKVWGVFSGLLGTLMLGSWIFSKNLDLHHNLCLLVFFPLDFVLMLIVLDPMKGKRYASLVRGYSLVRIAMIALAFVFSRAGVVHQEIWYGAGAWSIVGVISFICVVWLSSNVFAKQQT